MLLVCQLLPFSQYPLGVYLPALSSCLCMSSLQICTVSSQDNAHSLLCLSLLDFPHSVSLALSSVSS